MRSQQPGQRDLRKRVQTMDSENRTHRIMSRDKRAQKESQTYLEAEGPLSLSLHRDDARHARDDR